MQVPRRGLESCTGNHGEGAHPTFCAHGSSLLAERLKELNADEALELQRLKSMIYKARGGNIKHPLFEALRAIR